MYLDRGSRDMINESSCMTIFFPFWISLNLGFMCAPEDSRTQMRLFHWHWVLHLICVIFCVMQLVINLLKILCTNGAWQRRKLGKILQDWRVVYVQVRQIILKAHLLCFLPFQTLSVVRGLRRYYVSEENILWSTYILLYHCLMFSGLTMR